MKKALFSTLCILLLTTACSNTPKSDSDHSTIDIESGMNHLVEIKISDIAKEIRYVPLETKDSSLVGNKPSIRLLSDKILVTTSKQAMLFDKSTGKYICSVGHIGEDPEGYSNTTCFIGNDQLLYFFRQPNQLVKYDLNGRFIDKITLLDAKGTANSPTQFGYYDISDNCIIGHNSNLMGDDPNSLIFYDQSGVRKDSLLNQIVPLPRKSMDEINSFQVRQGKEKYGNIKGVIMVKYKDNTQAVSFPSAPVLWKSGKETRFKELFVDTIYTVRKNRLEPYLSFKTGKWHWPIEERNLTEKNEERIFISYVVENDRHIFFQCILGIHTENPVLHNGIYDKTNHSTILGIGTEGIKDDLTHFAAFYPSECTPSGEYASIIDAGTALDWLDKNPQADLSKLNFLKQIDEDSNPIVIIAQ